MTALHLGTWPPRDPDTDYREAMADSLWPPPDLVDEWDDAPPTTAAPASPAAPAPLEQAPWRPRHADDGPMSVFQQLVDRLPDDRLRAWRATGLDLKPSRWKGLAPAWWLKP